MGLGNPPEPLVGKDFGHEVRKAPLVGEAASPAGTVVVAMKLGRPRSPLVGGAGAFRFPGVPFP